MLLPSRPARFCPAAHQRGRAPSRRQWLKPGANDHPWAIRRAAGFVIQVSSATFGDISNDQMTSTLTIDSGGCRFSNLMAHAGPSSCTFVASSRRWHSSFCHPSGKSRNGTVVPVVGPPSVWRLQATQSDARAHSHISIDICAYRYVSLAWPRSHERSTESLMNHSDRRRLPEPPPRPLRNSRYGNRSTCSLRDIHRLGLRMA